MMEKSYQPGDIEAQIYKTWEDSGVFENNVQTDADPFTIMFPPPNVTGSLHMGHALTFTLQDILIRYNRMKGKDALWQPGSDHAGIATQMVVERNLAAEGIDRHDMGREAFLDRVWSWKEESGGTIQRQLRRLGASAAWSRDRFTMDEGLSAAVRKVFVQLHKDGLMYRDQRLVNWDPKLHTAISDLEVEQKDVNGKMWYFKYPLADDPTHHIIVGTTRPETMLGDTAVAVHPEDERYTDLVGKMIKLPLVDRLIPIIADEYPDPEKGSGAVKITPAHDFNDFEVGKRHDLPMINVLDANAAMNENTPAEYQGMDRYDARSKVVEAMEALGLLDKIEENMMVQPYGDRSGVVIEPWLTDQWYVNAAELAKPALAAVRDGRTKFVPQNWEKTYFDWLENIQPWCVSRQLWWGHQIPAWYGPDGTVFVEETEAEAQAAAEAHYGQATELTRDEDVLDTWFSSGLWPFSTLGWPEKTPELDKYYKTDVLVTGFDIIFFWVARMMMMGLYCTNEVPFHTVYIHALVRDEKGQKMSKSKGNVIDPLDLVDQYGADAVRFTLATMAAQGRDIKLAVNRVEGYRNFGTKLWNAARFCQMNGCAPEATFDPSKVQSTLAKWLVGETMGAIQTVTEGLEQYRFNEASLGLYQYVWGTFCDWFIELAKPVFQSEDKALAAEVRATAAWALDQILRLLHPFMPHLSEELWAGLADHRANPLIIEAWPTYDAALIAQEASDEMNWVINSITAVRSVRAEMNVPASAKLPLLVTGDQKVADRMATHGAIMKRLARLETLDITTEPAPKGAVQVVLDGATAALPIADVIDVAAEHARLTKDLGKLDKEISGLAGRLSNPKFIEKAPEDVIADAKQQQADATEKREKVLAALSRLDEVSAA